MWIPREVRFNDKVHVEDQIIKLRFGRFVKEARSDRHYTQEVLADYARTTQPTISDFEHGFRGPTLLQAHAIAAALGYPLSTFLLKADL